MAPLFTQNQIVWDLQSEGFNVTVRDLRYWRDLNKLPQLYHGDNTFYYNEEVIPEIKALCYGRNKYEVENLMSLSLEGEEFIVHKLEIVKHNGKYIYKYYTGDTILIQEKGELNVNGTN